MLLNISRTIAFKELSDTAQDDILNDFKQDAKRSLVLHANHAGLSYEEYLRKEYDLHEEFERDDLLETKAKEAINIHFSGKIDY